MYSANSHLETSTKRFVQSEKIKANWALRVREQSQTPEGAHLPMTSLGCEGNTKYVGRERECEHISERERETDRARDREVKSPQSGR